MLLFIWNAAMAWVVIALAETIHGILRVMFLTPRLGDRRGRQMGVASGSIIILSLGWCMIPSYYVNPSSLSESLAVGAVWFILMLVFEIGLGRFVFGFSWQHMAAEYNLRNGGFLGLGMTVLFLTPLIIAKLRGLF
jgi:hypothetical protein